MGEDGIVIIELGDLSGCLFRAGSSADVLRLLALRLHSFKLKGIE